MANLACTAIIHWRGLSEGGRKQPPIGPIYGATACLVDADDPRLFSVVLRFIGTGRQPGQLGDRVELGFLDEDSIVGTILLPGTKLVITEGPHIVADCEVLSVIEKPQV